VLLHSSSDELERAKLVEAVPVAESGVHSDSAVTGQEQCWRRSELVYG
jgi:hypothetical protein